MEHKYIDAEKLKEEIERRRDSALTRQKNLEKIGQETVLNEMIAAELNRLLSFITSLQQKQPDCHTVEEWMQHIKNSDQLTKDIFSKGPYDVLYDALNHTYQHCYDAIKEFGELCFQTGVNSVKQEQSEMDIEQFISDFMEKKDAETHGRWCEEDIIEAMNQSFALGLNAKKEQPEVDLEKELDQWRHEHFAGERDGHYNGEYLERSSQLDLARHFYELGKNARKEE